MVEVLASAEAELKARLGAEHPMHGDSHALQRFLIARKLDIDETSTMIEAHVAWRAATLPVPRTPALVQELRKGKWFVRGHDRAGRPLFMIKSGKFDPKERDLQTALASVVMLLEETLSTVPPTGKMVVFYDRTDFSLRKK